MHPRLRIPEERERDSGMIPNTDSGMKPNSFRPIPDSAFGFAGIPTRF